MELSALLNKMFIFIVLMVIGYVLARRGLFGPAFPAPNRTSGTLPRSCS